jgi:hypothetical protein
MVFNVLNNKCLTICLILNLYLQVIYILYYVGNVICEIYMQYLPLDTKQQTVNDFFCLRYIHLFITRTPVPLKGYPPTVKHNII